MPNGELRNCELCGRAGMPLTRHHLIPRAVHRKPRTARAFEAGEPMSRIALFCRSCHKLVHSVLSEKELAFDYNTIDRLLAHPEISKFVRWVADKPPGLRVPFARRRG